MMADVNPSASTPKPVPPVGVHQTLQGAVQQFHLAALGRERRPQASRPHRRQPDGHGSPADPGAPAGRHGPTFSAAAGPGTPTPAPPAYYRWLNRGAPPEDDWADWFAAEKDILPT